MVGFSLSHLASGSAPASLSLTLSALSYVPPFVYRAVKKFTGKGLWAPPLHQNYLVAQSFASTQTTWSEL